MTDTGNTSQLNQQHQETQQQLSQLMQMMEKISKRLDDLSLQMQANAEAIQKIQKNHGEGMEARSFQKQENELARSNFNPPKTMQGEDKDEDGDSEKGLSTSRSQYGTQQQERSVMIDIPNGSPIVGIAVGKSLETPLSILSKKKRKEKLKFFSGEIILIEGKKMKDTICIALADDVSVIFDPGGVHQENREKDWWRRRRNLPKLRRQRMMKTGGNLEEEWWRRRQNLPELLRRRQMMKLGGEKNSSSTLLSSSECLQKEVRKEENGVSLKTNSKQGLGYTPSDQPSVLKDKGSRSSFWQSQSKLTTWLGSTTEMEIRSRGGCKLGSCDINGRVEQQVKGSF